MPLPAHACAKRHVSFLPLGWLLIVAMLVVPSSPAHATLPLNVVFSEDFSYTAGTDLPDTAAWDGTATNNEIEIDSAGPWLKFTGGSGYPNAYHVMSYSGSNNVIFVHILVRPGTGTATMWGLWFNDPAGNNLARWYGAATSCRGRIGGTNTVTSSFLTLTPDQWNDLDARINTLNNTSEFYLNGAYVGTLDHTSTPSNTLGQIRFERLDNPGAAGHLIYFDELRVGQDPGPPTGPPAAPTVDLPASGSVVQTLTPSLAWVGDFHDMYEVHINTTNYSADTDGWDSGQVAASPGLHTVGSLQNGTRYYVFVRLHNAIGWGAWSAAGYYFDVNIPLPAAPTVAAPASGSVVQTQTPTIQWNGDVNDAYEVHVNTTDNWADADGWDSGQVAGSPGSCTTGVLQNWARYYVFVRLHSVAGWGPWSAAGYYFDVRVPPLIIPQPQDAAWYPGTGFQVNAQTRIVMPTNPDAKDNLTAVQLQRRLWDMTGHLPPIVQGGPGAPTDNVIAIGESTRNTAVAAIIASWPDAAGKAPRSEGYLLGVADGSVVIQGFDQRGTFYGCQTYAQLLEQFGTAPAIGCFCYDYPDRPWRGMMVRVRYKFDIEWSKEVMSELIARFKFNIVQFDISYGTIWDSHPELYLDDPAIASHMDEIQSVADYAKQYFLEVIPAGPSWTHCDEFTTAGTLNTLLRENRLDADPSPDRETLCPRNPQAQQLIHDLWTELINRFQPSHLHIGWDEISTIGNSQCPYCAGVAPTTLFNEFLWNDYNWLHARGITPIMWADMLTTEMNGGAPWNLYQVAATMPKGIILEDWEYLLSQTYTRLQNWNNNGLSSLGSPFGVYNPGIANIWWWGHSVKQYNTLGMVAFNKFRFGNKSDLLVAPPGDAQMQNLACYPFVAGWSWSPDVPYYDPAPYDGKVVVRMALAPDKVTSLAASIAGQDVNLSWTNPADSTYQATWICSRTDRPPTSPLDGTLVADVPGTPGGPGSFTHTAAPLCPTLYYAAFAHDGVRHFSPASTVSLTGTSLTDTDGDGVADVCDQCPNTIPGMAGQLDAQGCPPPVPGDFDHDGDVDQDDFSLFAACASGPGVPYSQGCSGRNLDGDSDVDQADFGLFQRCLSGPNMPADPNCTN